MVAAANPADHRGSSRNGGRLFTSRRSPPGDGKTGPGGQHRPDPGKTGHRGDHRLWRGVGRPRHRPTRTAARSQSLSERLRALPGDDRTGALAWPQRQGDLAGAGGHVQLHGRLPERPALRPQASPQPRAGSVRGDRDRTWRGGPGRLRHRPDGPRRPERQVPPHAAVRDDVGLQPQVGSSAGLPFQFADLGGVT